MKKFFLLMCIALASLVTGCTRIETGEVGMRVNFDKTINPTELQPGSWNQVLIGDVITFPVKDITVTSENKTPLTADNTALADFDVTLVYGINPAKVADIYTTKSRSFHTVHNGDIYLMHDYLVTVVNNASYKAVRQYPALLVADNREKLEAAIVADIKAQLEAEGLGQSINITKVMVRNALPNKQILEAATEYVRAQNELKVKTTEVEIAKKEAERMAALASQGQQSIAFMQAKAQLNISEGIAAGRVHTIVVPADFRGMVNVGK